MKHSNFLRQLPGVLLVCFVFNSALHAQTTATTTTSDEQMIRNLVA